MTKAHEHDWQLDYSANAYWCACGANMTLEELMEKYSGLRHMVEVINLMDMGLQKQLTAAQERIKTLEAVLEKRPPVANCNTPGYVAWHKQAQAALDGDDTEAE